MDTRPDQPADRPELKHSGRHEDDRHVQVELCEDQEKTGQNEAAESQPGRDPGHEMLQESPRNGAFVFLRAIKDHLEQHGDRASVAVRVFCAPAGERKVPRAVSGQRHMCGAAAARQERAAGGKRAGFCWN